MTTGAITLGGFKRISFPEFAHTPILTANATGTQAAGTQITAMYARFGTVAAGASATLPKAKGGMQIIVFNEGANPLLVFPWNTDQIDGLGASNAYTVGVGDVITFFGQTGGQWYSDTPNGNLVGSVNGAVAAAGTTQGTATPVTGNLVNVSTGTANQGILLPVGVPGTTIVVNNATGNTIKIYPNGTGQIDAGGASTAQTLTSAHRGCTLYCFAANLWISSLFGAATS